MQVTLSSNDRNETNRLMRADDLALALHEFNDYLRQFHKYREWSKEEELLIEAVRSAFFEVLESRNIDLDSY